MKKRCFNIIDDLINDDTDQNKFILDMACIFFDLGKEIFGVDYFNILKEYLDSNEKTVDEIVLNCSISHSSYYRKMKKIYLVLTNLIDYIQDMCLERMKILSDGIFNKKVICFTK